MAVIDRKMLNREQLNLPLSFWVVNTLMSLSLMTAGERDAKARANNASSASENTNLNLPFVQSLTSKLSRSACMNTLCNARLASDSVC